MSGATNLMISLCELRNLKQAMRDLAGQSGKYHS
jgi:hypothetical protein